MDKDFELAVCKYYEIVKEKCESLLMHIKSQNSRTIKYVSLTAPVIDNKQQEFNINEREECVSQGQTL